jgi:hypothetical protein
MCNAMMVRGWCPKRRQPRTSLHRQVARIWREEGRAWVGLCPCDGMARLQNLL